tara:strand:+ start:25 stop:546 length:522 start_codon:yes stop_codon:yes gene_type:complete
LRYIIIVFILCLLAFNVNSQKIATFQFALIIENLESYKDFKIQLNKFKEIKFSELNKEEELLVSKKKELEESKIILSEIKYLSKISEFNEQKKNFEQKVINLNNYLKENIEINENKILKEIVNIIRKISLENGIDIVFSDEQYFLTSDTIDISGKIYNDLNKLNIVLQLSKYE